MVAKLNPVLAIVLILRFAVLLTCSAATLYTVGDNSGWDISTNLNTWTNGKTFLVGDVLLFQYSSYHSVSEVTKDNYDVCNTTRDVLQTSSNGNTSFPLTTPGDRYFVCGNRLHCLAGMKLHVNVVEDQAAGAPGNAPQAARDGGGSLPPASTKNNNNPYNNPSSAILNQAGLIFNLALVLALLSFSPVFSSM